MKKTLTVIFIFTLAACSCSSQELPTDSAPPATIDDKRQTSFTR